ncbi:type I-E CRISPR-associated protein Cse1/CasA [Paracoccus litorisediminis]|uniref:type I-E CRISPR-associated protein Cse1/CasA n=1 Tax=Paracoccus litorisediminis TaxID=2006130 RepID=UPI0037343B7C
MKIGKRIDRDVSPKPAPQKHNLIEECWIPVLRKSGETVLVKPGTIASSDLVRPMWPRADLDTNCLEFLIGLVYIACPPADRKAWLDGFKSPPDLNATFARLVPAFNLLGEGPRFMQDPDAGAFTAQLAAFERDEAKGRTANHLDILFFDCAGVKTTINNADILSWRGRYERDGELDRGMAAMALFGMQTQAPSGGAGNRVSLRGGGPLVTLVDPGTDSLWDLVWANVPYGRPLADLQDLPWMRSDRRHGTVHAPTSDGDTVHAEALFGMPRRFRLIDGDMGIRAAMQVPNGNDYGVWRHPLTPYYRSKGDISPVLAARSGGGYRNWVGAVLATEDHIPAQTVLRWRQDRPRDDFRLLLSGWKMDRAMPISFLLSEQPFTDGDLDHEDDILDLIEAAAHACRAICLAIRKSIDIPANCEENSKSILYGVGSDKEALRGAWGVKAYQDFYQLSENLFRRRIQEMRGKGKAAIAQTWLADLRNIATTIFDRYVTGEIHRMTMTRRKLAVQNHRALVAVMAGYGKAGAKIYQLLGLEVPVSARTRSAA